MNKIINNLAQIADAAEYFDRKTGAAWKIRSCLTNMLVWGANAYINAQRSGDMQREFNAMTQLGTLRVWAQDSNTSALVLDLTPAAVRKTLGLERIIDIHAEATAEARMKCIQTRSATKFKQYYDAAANAFEERRKQREENVETIAYLLSDNSFNLSPELCDYMRTFEGMNYSGEILDSEAYDDAAVERQSDTLAECVGNALEAMYDVCDSELAASITTAKTNRLLGYHKAILQMMDVAGVDKKRLAERRAKLDALIEEQIAKITADVNDINADIDVQLADMQVENAPAPTEEPSKPKMYRVPQAA